MSNHGTGKLGPDELTSVEDFPAVPAGPAQGATNMAEGEDFVRTFARPELVGHETRPARPRVGGGELVRDTRSTHHECRPPDHFDLDYGTIWRCDCGRRYTLNPDGGGGAHWLRRFWPWPR